MQLTHPPLDRRALGLQVHLTSCRHAYTNSLPAHIAARRLTDIHEMRTEERSQPLSNGSILEYIVRGEYAWKKSDTNSTY
eukprot:scaffold36033_cov49-Phaeocystis_antarctica.AAC.1